MDVVDLPFADGVRSNMLWRRHLVYRHEAIRSSDQNRLFGSTIFTYPKGVRPAGPNVPDVLGFLAIGAFAGLRMAEIETRERAGTGKKATTPQLSRQRPPPSGAAPNLFSATVVRFSKTDAVGKLRVWPVWPASRPLQAQVG